MCLRVDGQSKTYKIHQLVLLAFSGAMPDGAVSRHLDGNPKNNCASNLAWGTALENSQDMVAHGRSLAGEKHFKAKLTAVDVAAIRKRIASGDSLVSIARAWGVRPGTIGHIKFGRNWKSIA